MFFGSSGVTCDSPKFIANSVWAVKYSVWMLVVVVVGIVVEEKGTNGICGGQNGKHVGNGDDGGWNSENGGWLCIGLLTWGWGKEGGLKDGTLTGSCGQKGKQSSNWMSSHTTFTTVSPLELVLELILDPKSPQDVRC